MYNIFSSGYISIMKKMYLFCGMTGLSLEVLWTGFYSFLHGDLRLTGISSFWMFWIYGCACVIHPLFHRIHKIPFWGRGLFYMILIFTGEFLFGIFLKRLGLCPWDYSDTPYHILGVIRLDYAPLWFFTGLLYEFLLRTFFPT